MTFSSGFLRSTPDSAREEITRLRASPSLTAKELALLDRLASDPIMSEVWAKLPNRQSCSGEIVRKVFDAASWRICLTMALAVAVSALSPEP
jgi:hypothetical protein